MAPDYPGLTAFRSLSHPPPPPNRLGPGPFPIDLNNACDRAMRVLEKVPHYAKAFYRSPAGRSDGARASAS